MAKKSFLHLVIFFFFSKVIKLAAVWFLVGSFGKPWKPVTQWFLNWLHTGITWGVLKSSGVWVSPSEILI